MTKPIMKYITDKIDYPPSGVDDFIAWLNEKVLATGVPRADVGIDVTTHYEYGDESASLFLCYKRLETIKEMDERLDQENRQKLWEQNQYERLKKKFEKSST